MKHRLQILCLICLVFLLTACSSDDQNPIMIKDSDVSAEILEEDNLKFDIEQIILSKGFQNLEPNVEIIKKDDGFRLLTSLGLFHTSGVRVTDINKSGDEINIYIENISKKSENQLAIPQILIELKDVKLRSIENVKFNIINENYQPIKLKISANEITNKINSDFQIITNTSPEINIVEDKDKLLWVLNYTNILDKYNLETPIVNLSVKVDANSGELIKSSKNFISQFIDEGNILNYIPNEYILYKKVEQTLTEDKWYSLWKYDINSNTKSPLYSSNSEIFDAQYSPDYESIALLESNDGANQLYILSKDDSKAYRVVFEHPINPSIIRWKDSNNLYLLNKTDMTSIIYNYNIKDANTSLVKHIYSDIVGLQVQDDHKLITIKDKDTENTSIKLTSDLVDSQINLKGFMPRFINDKYIGYLEFDEKNSINKLILLNRENNKIHDTILLNISNFYNIDDKTIG
ncbi:MAG TPA: hypothetical protein VFC79_02750, partial [Tissierellaceae bacterium]|nr:hypothetical protein [Tissierellaceae bacterium]